MIRKHMRVIIGMALIATLIFSIVPMDVQAKPTGEFNTESVGDLSLSVSETIDMAFTGTGEYSDTITVSFEADETPDPAYVEIRDVTISYYVSIIGDAEVHIDIGIVAYVWYDDEVIAWTYLRAFVSTSADNPGEYASATAMISGEAYAIIYKNEMLAASFAKGSAEANSASSNSGYGDSESEVESQGYALTSWVHSSLDVDSYSYVYSDTGGIGISNGKANGQVAGIGAYPVSISRRLSTLVKAFNGLPNLLKRGASIAFSTSDGYTSSAANVNNDGHAFSESEVHSHGGACPTEGYFGADAWCNSEIGGHEDSFSGSTSQMATGSPTAQAKTNKGDFSVSMKGATIKDEIEANGIGDADSEGYMDRYGDGWEFLGEVHAHADYLSNTWLESDFPFATISAEVSEVYSREYASYGTEWGKIWIVGLYIDSSLEDSLLNTKHGYFHLSYAPSADIMEYDETTIPGGSLLYVRAPKT